MMGGWSESISTSWEPRKGCALACSCLKDILHGMLLTALKMMEAEKLNWRHLMDKKAKLGRTFASHGALTQGWES